MRGPIALMVSDHAVMSSLTFALSIEGFELAAANDVTAAVLVIDQDFAGDGLAALVALRARGAAAPAIILATNPAQTMQRRIAAARAELVEKPLMDDELNRKIAGLLGSAEVA